MKIVLDTLWRSVRMEMVNLVGAVVVVIKVENENAWRDGMWIFGVWLLLTVAGLIEYRSRLTETQKLSASGRRLDPDRVCWHVAHGAVSLALLWIYSVLDNKVLGQPILGFEHHQSLVLALLLSFLLTGFSVVYRAPSNTPTFS